MDSSELIQRLLPQPEILLSRDCLQHLMDVLYRRFANDDVACAQYLFDIYGLSSTNADFVALIDQLSSIWKHPTFQVARERVDREDERAENPYPVSEGAIQCFRCAQWKTLSLSLQLRSGDESMTIFVQCVVCNHTWTM